MSSNPLPVSQQASVVTLPSGRAYRAEAGESLLAAALRAEITLEHSCRTGRCSACKAKVSSGQTQALAAELGLTAEEREQGWILTCVRAATGDVTLDVADLGNVTLPVPKTVPCRIASLDRLAPDVVKVTLRLPPAQAVSYFPGQYIDVIGPAGVRRSYSLANAPAADKLLELHIREAPGGVMSRYWFQEAKANDLLRLHGPLGTFFLRDVADKHLVFLATGTGIAPVKAMLEGLASTPPGDRPRAITIYWGGRTPADLYWHPGAIDIEHTFVPVLSRADDTWPGARGHIQQVATQQRAEWSNTAVYACGSDAMIHSARGHLVAAGLDPRHFHSDAFVCSA